MKKLIYLALLGLTLAACGGATATQAGAANTAGTPSPASSSRPEMGGLDLATRLAVGTLRLEGSDLAVSPAQAAELLPLWKAVRSLSASDTASAAEIQALYDQIQETMTSEQAQAQSDLALSAADMTALMAELGIESAAFTGRGAGAAEPADLSEGELATRVAQRQAQGGAPLAGGPPGGGGEMTGQMPAGGFPGQGDFQGTPAAGQNSARRGMGMNSPFLDPLISLLAERAAE